MKKKAYRKKYSNFKVLSAEELKDAKAEVIKEEKPKKKTKKGAK